MSLRKLSGKVSAAAAAAAAGPGCVGDSDGGVPHMCCLCVYVCVLLSGVFLSISRWNKKNYRFVCYLTYHMKIIFCGNVMVFLTHEWKYSITGF